MPVVGGPGSHRRSPATSDEDPEDCELTALLGPAFAEAITAMLLVDPAGQITDANSPATQLLGDDALVGRDFAALWHREANPGLGFDTLLAAAGTEGGADGLAVLVTATGVKIPVTIRLNPVRTAPGERRLLIQLHDLTPGYRHFAADLPPQTSAFIFDRDLRIVAAAGRDTGSGRYSTDGLTGRLLRDIAPASAVEFLEPRYRTALAGERSAFEYSSRVDGVHYRVSVRPIGTAAGDIVGIVAFSEDVTADRVRQHQLEQVHQLSRLGSCFYSVADGWVFDQALLDLVGMNSGTEAMTAMDLLVLPEDRDQARGTYRRVLQAGGKSTLQYRLTHGRTGTVRHMSGAVEAVVDDEGTLLSAVLTFADVTDAVRAEQDRATSARSRTELLRRISDAIAMLPTDLRQMMHTVADVTAAALGDCTVISVFTADGGGVEQELMSVADENSAPASPIADQARDAVRRGIGLPGGEPSAVTGEFFSSIDNPDWRADFESRIGYPAHPGISHVISAPIRYDGRLVGRLRVFRFEPDNPFQPGDDDLLQVLADRTGAAIVERRMRAQLELQRTQARVIGDRLKELTAEQRELLDQLAGVEERERTLLAEAIHDGPMQLIVAVMMRLENLGISGSNADMQEVEELVDTLETSVQRLRTLIVALTPPDLTEGMAAALNDLAQGIFIGTGTQITFAGVRHVPLTPLRKQNALRILREALVNVRKHARAQHVLVELEQADGQVIARIVDDGVGAHELDAGPGHLGMATMRARASAEGGHLDVRGIPDVGTTVTLMLPANRAQSGSDGQGATGRRSAQ